MPCVLAQKESIWTIDTAHPAYPSLPKRPKYPTPQQSTCFAGTALKQLLKKWFKITATENCSCNARAEVMDANGCDWCEQNIKIILDWLAEEAKKRKLPFNTLAGKIIVKRAIAHARKAEKDERQPG
jgi:hypothetical protein